MTLHTLQTRTAAETQLALQFAGLGAVDADRADAFAAFAKTGLPSRRNEAWHYTDLRAAMRAAAPLAPRRLDATRLSKARAVLAERPRLGGARFALVDGVFAADLSDPAPSGVTAGLLAKYAPFQHPDPVLKLNDAFSSTGLSIHVDEGVAVETSVEIAHVVTTPGEAVYSRSSLQVGKRARVRLVETFLGADSGVQRNVAMRANLDDGAKCEIVSIVDDSADLHLESQVVGLGEAAEFAAFALVSGGALVRRQIFVSHKRRGAKIALAGLALLDGKRHADTTLEVTHAAPHGESREFYRHIVADEAIGVFQGKVIVEQRAQKTDGGMKSQAILLSPTAQMNNKPELEIFADDVVCGHGATVGALDPEQMFYMQARGIEKEQAEAMLLEAFGVEAIERIGDEDLRDAVLQRARAWLQGRGAKR